ncbi:MAG: hypothetical protein WD021_11110 [Rhodothermales bacterium]
MKPLRQTASREGWKHLPIYEAAREKIAYDLAFEVGAPVPPVVLFRRSDPLTTKGEIEHACVSLAPYPTFYNLQHVVKRYRKMRRWPNWRIARRSLSRALPLHWWIDHYRGVKAKNYVWGEGPNCEPRLLCIDHAAAFNLKMGNCERMRVPSEIGFEGSWLDTREASVTADRIQALEESQISEIVNRIPDDFMPEEYRAKVLQFALERRERLKEIMDERLYRKTKSTFSSGRCIHLGGEAIPERAR